MSAGHLLLMAGLNNFDKAVLSAESPGRRSLRAGKHPKSRHGRHTAPHSGQSLKCHSVPGGPLSLQAGQVAEQKTPLKSLRESCSHPSAYLSHPAFCYRVLSRKKPNHGCSCEKPLNLTLTYILRLRLFTHMLAMDPMSNTPHPTIPLLFSPA